MQLVICLSDISTQSTYIKEINDTFIGEGGGLSATTAANLSMKWWQSPKSNDVCLVTIDSPHIVFVEQAELSPAFSHH